MTAVPGQILRSLDLPTVSPIRWPSSSTRTSATGTMAPSLADRASRAPGSQRIGDVHLLGGRYRELDLNLDHGARTLWCFMRPNRVPSFTPELLQELIAVRAAVQRLFEFPGVIDD